LPAPPPQQRQREGDREDAARRRRQYFTGLRSEADHQQDRDDHGVADSRPAPLQRHQAL
jgi:hypothetical protein